MVPCTITDGDSDEFENDVGVEWYFFTDTRESNIQKLIPPRLYFTFDPQNQLVLQL